MDINAILSEQLTPKQREAAIDIHQEILCLACAGSGKSRTLAYRIAYLISQGCMAEEIVAFTFTEKAAESLKRRVAEALAVVGLSSSLVGAMYIGTIHSYCQYLLGSVTAEYRQFEVLDENKLKLYLLSRYYDLNLNNIQNQKKVGQFTVIKEVANAWSTVNDEMMSFDSIVQEDELLGNLLKDIYNKMHEEQFIDFSLMVRLAVEELEKETNEIKELLKNISHLMVDEYQDINPVQERLILSLKGHVKSLMVVGDDDQSIYAWRGADVNNILEFENRYPNCAKHTLSTNFRSTSDIVQASDSFIQQELGPLRYSKNPVSKSDGNIKDFRSVWFDTRDQEAEWVANMIQSLIGTEYVEKYNDDGTPKEIRGLTPADFAILFRSIRRSYNPKNLPHRHYEFTKCMKEKNILYSLDSEGGIFERPHAVIIRQIMELLRDKSPSRDEVKDLFKREIITYFSNANFKKLTQVMAEWGIKIHTPSGTTRRRVYPQEFLQEIFVALGVQDSDFDDIIMRDLGVFSSIILDIEKVYVSIDSLSRYRQILNFLSNVAESGYDVSTLDVIAKPDAVTISTIHKMKGLEFPVVFIVDVVDRRFPSDKSQYSGWVPAKLMASAINRGAYCTSRPDEARLFYTAMTRAERFLYISGAAQQPDAVRLKKPSTFKARIDAMNICKDSNVLPIGLKKISLKRRIDETLLPTSYSEIKDFLTCPMSYKLKKHFGFNPVVPDLFGFGQTTHTIIERLHQIYKNVAPSEDEAIKVAREIFHLKHIFPSSNPINNPGPYEHALNSAIKIAQNYVGDFEQDFNRIKEDEVRFEINIGQALVSGAIDLLLKHDDDGEIMDAHVIDFKSLEKPKESSENDWIDLSLQVQLYAYAAKKVLSEKAQTGSVHLLKENTRIDIPVDDEALNSAVENIKWAVEQILDGDFPSRPCAGKCDTCDVNKVCAKKPQSFKTSVVPPEIKIPVENKAVEVRAISEYDCYYLVKK